MKISKKAQGIEPSTTLVLLSKAKKMQEKYGDVINLSVGEPDFSTPNFIKEAAIAAIKEGKSDSYTVSTGILPLKKAIVDDANKRYQTHFLEDNVVVTVGAKFSLYVLAQVLLDEGDEVLIPLPFWVSYGEQVKLAGGTPVFVEPNNGLKINVADLSKKLSKKTKVLILNSPQNPSGLVYTKQELKEIGNWAVENNIIVVADDIYGDLVYNGTKFVSLMNLDEKIRRQTILVSGLSKSYAMTGWRVGFTIAPSNVIKAMTKLIGHSTSNLAAVSQYAALAAFTIKDDSVSKMRDEYEKRLNELYPLVNSIPGFNLENKPQGAFYMFPDVSEALKITGLNSADKLAEEILNEVHVAVVSGSGFGMNKRIRLSYAANLLEIKTAIERIKKFMKRYVEVQK